jgi:hypothetical protein
MRSAEIDRNVGRNGRQERLARIPHDAMRQRSALLAVKMRVLLRFTPARRAGRSRQVFARRENLLPDRRGAGLVRRRRAGGGGSGRTPSGGGSRWAWRHRGQERAIPKSWGRHSGSASTWRVPIPPDRGRIRDQRLAQISRSPNSLIEAPDNLPVPERFLCGTAAFRDPIAPSIARKLLTDW